MAKEQTEARLKLIHLVYGLLGAALLIGIAIGAMKNQQVTNTKEIQGKVGKEVYEQHQEEQLRSNKRMYEGIEKLDGKLDKIIENK
jgi:hypothetical protein